MGAWKKHLKEIGLGIIFIFILSNIISYLRQPNLDSTILPAMHVTLVEGTEYVVKTGKPLVLHFWATWCPTCKLEASNIETVSKTYEVLSIAVHSGDNAKIKAYMAKKDLTFRIVNDSEGVLAKQFHVEAYPTTFIYNGKGVLSFTEVGYTTTAGLLARLKMIEL